jgi:hypothetical protein
MTTLLKELLAISENKSFDVLVEKLGTLQQLKLGKLSRALNQAYRDNGASAVQNKFANRYDTPLGTNSSILDIGYIKNYSNVTKAYREDESIVALALSTSPTANAFALVLMDADSSSKRSRMVGMAYDLMDLNLDEAVIDSIFKLKGSTEKAGWGGEEDVESEKKSSRSIKTHGEYVSRYDKERKDPSKKEQEKTFSDYEDWYDHAAKHNATVKNDGNTKIAVDRRGNTIAVWYKETKKGTSSVETISPFNNEINHSYGKPSSYEGKTYSVADVRKFIEILLEAGVKVYARAATRDVASIQARNNRYSNRAN